MSKRSKLESADNNGTSLLGKQRLIGCYNRFVTFEDAKEPWCAEQKK